MSYAFIFDFDGVLVDSMPAHFAAYKQALAEVNVPVDEAQFYRQAGLAGQDQLRYFAEKAGAAVDIRQVYERTREILRANSQPAEAIDCNVALIKLLHSQGVPVAIATGSSLERVLPVLQAHAIEVDALVTAEDAPRGKPAPDIFLRAAARLGADPARCIVIEDSEAGLEAARAAGMHAYRYYSPSNSGGENDAFPSIPGS